MKRKPRQQIIDVPPLLPMTKDQRAAACRDRYHIIGRAMRHPASLAELRQIAAASTFIIKRFPPGVPLGWKPSWME